MHSGSKVGGRILVTFVSRQCGSIQLGQTDDKFRSKNSEIM